MNYSTATGLFGIASSKAISGPKALINYTKATCKQLAELITALTTEAGASQMAHQNKQLKQKGGRNAKNKIKQRA